MAPWSASKAARIEAMPLRSDSSVGQRLPASSCSCCTSASPDGDKRRAHVEGPEPLGAWIAGARRCLKPRGRLALIHRADRLPEILARLQAGFGDIEILPLWPMRGRAAKRVILRARLGARGGATLLAGLLLDEPGGGYYAAAQRVRVNEGRMGTDG